MKQSSTAKPYPHGGRKLCPADVRLIRALVAERRKHEAEVRKLSNAELAKKFGVGIDIIWKIATGRAWLNVN